MLILDMKKNLPLKVNWNLYFNTGVFCFDFIAAIRVNNCLRKKAQGYERPGFKARTSK